ncbi:hypothetical protein CNMCM6106_008468 [Aspergillus hiratsukae]|uniref:Integrase catalytic domain-containing protein n=1 Tax=Aspergillus hiratsukae TaxID=1194566 RepID=A0A8H6QK56_9EURO|nr:hypothetical protein CNMCM6106_008468 [Aspergillus hiratsukae]
MKGSLLSTQMLYADGIFNSHDEEGYRFYRKDRKTLATGYNIDRTSYLGWVKSENTLLSKFLNGRREFAYLAKDEPDWVLLHRRFGHPGKPRMKRLAKRIGLTLPVDQVMCETCIQAKSVKKQNRGDIPKETEPLRLVYIDFWGPYDGQYYLSITDSATRFSWVYITDNRRTETVIGILEKWMSREERELGTLLVNIRLDNAREFVALKPWATEKGIDLEFTEPYTPPQNGPAERLNRMLLELARALLLQMQIPKRYWRYAVQMANFIRNRTVFNLAELKKDVKSPYEALYGKQYDLTTLRVPFCKVWFHVETDDKLDPRAREGVFIGYTKSSSQYLILDKKGRVRKVTNPIFMEDQPGFIAREAGERDLANDDAFKRLIYVGDRMQEGENGARPEPAVVADVGSDVQAGHEVELSSPMAEEEYFSSPARASLPEPSQASSPQPESPNLRRSVRTRQPTRALVESQETEQIYGRKNRQERRREEREAQKPRNDSSQVSEAARLRDVANLAVAIELMLGEDDEFALRVDNKMSRYDSQGEERIPIPQTYEEAVNHPVFGRKWREAIGLELRNLIRFGTWQFVKRPVGRSVITCKWVFDVKYGADGRLERFKARLVARGFSQREGLDFEDTFAPVIRLESLRILFAIAAIYGLTAHLLDATNAFVGSKVDKEMYMELPEGLDDHGFGPTEPDQVCEILQSLYGLRQSANLWNQKVKNFVTTIGFKPSTADSSVFINNRGIIIALYVDDILVFGKDTRDIEKVKDKLKSFHIMKDSGLVTKILGIRISWLPKGKGIRLDQEFYAQRILEEFGMMKSKERTIPLSPSTDLNQKSPRLPKVLHSKFRHIIGRLTYLAGGTRLDIQFSVNRLSQHLAEPTKVHLEAVKRILRYIRHTIKYAITYSAKGSDSATGNDILVGYVDASYGNATKGRSTSGYVFILAGGPISWSSRKQPITAMSSSEAEYVAAADGAKQAVWLRHFLHSIQKLGNREATPFYMDNQSAMKLSENPVLHSRSKHIHLRYHAIRDFVDHQEIKPTYIPTKRMVADGLTKASNNEKLGYLVKSLCLDCSG